MAAIPPNEKSEKYKNLRAEYAAANRYSQHLTVIQWQVGSILVGGGLAAVGLSLTAKQGVFAPVFVTLAAIVGIISWFFFLRRNSEFAGIANWRMVAIEQELGLELQWRLNSASGRLSEPYPTVHGPSGYRNVKWLTIILVVVLSGLIVYLFLHTAWPNYIP